MGLILTVSYGYPDPKRKDSQLANAVISQTGALEASLDLKKRLFNKAAMEPFSKLKSELFHGFIYKQLLPWQRGSYLIPPHLVQSTADKLNDIKVTWEACVNEFRNNYDMRKANARVELGKLWKEDEFPDLDKLTEKFHFDWQFERLPATVDGCPHGALIQHMQDHMERKLKDSVSAPVKDLVRSTANLINVLTENKKAWKSSTLTNVQDAVSKIPDLSRLLNDPDLERIAGDLNNTLSGITADELRNDELQRTMVATLAKQSVDELLAKLGGLAD